MMILPAPSSDLMILPGEKGNKTCQENLMVDHIHLTGPKYPQLAKQLLTGGVFAVGISQIWHLDMNPSNCEWWNLVALCQRCHLTIQAKVILERPWILDHSEWFKPYVAGYYAQRLGYQTCKDFVFRNIDKLISEGSGVTR